MNKLRGSVAVMSLSLLFNLGAEMPLVNIAKINPDIRCSKMRSAMKWYLCPEAAQCLSDAQEEMEGMGYCLVLDEAYVPYSTHKRDVEMSSVCDREECLRHCCGIAVDVCMEMADGTSLPMPTEFDVFTPEASPDCMDLSPEVMMYRDMLCEIMERHGFKRSPNLWYHFEYTQCDSCYFDIPFEDLV
jgi:zinc D-Ala-D-Ala dipeptidase